MSDLDLVPKGGGGGLLESLDAPINDGPCQVARAGRPVKTIAGPKVNAARTIVFGGVPGLLQSEAPQRFASLRRVVGSAVVEKMRVTSEFRFMRTWTQIRDDRLDVVMFCIGCRSTLKVAGFDSRSRAGYSRGFVASSRASFAFAGSAGETSELLLLAVPAPRVRELLGRDLRAGYWIPDDNSELLYVAEQLLRLSLACPTSVTPHLSEHLISSALFALCEVVRRRVSAEQRKPTITEQRLAAIMRYIDTHLSDPALSAAAVACDCGISPRYLSKLLRHYGTPFAQLVWAKRMKVACDWLQRTCAEEVSVSQIAYQVGFKSAAHFSRMFKKTYSRSPSLCRRGSEFKD